ncbi:hypothetical protein CCMA1212_002127 [Trichoderma ghanense]|uniref:SSCRP protein n=1 Tax=Trichoderma ghanense TaxID=65468 RepID=A0ABY2HE58_9HYPO
MKTPSFALVSALLLGASALTLPTQPAADSGCCCCDISKGQIDCDRSIPASECVCAQVICPANAPTVWHGTPPPVTGPPTFRPTPAPAPPHLPGPKPKPKPQPVPGLPKLCCCCDPSVSKIRCEFKPAIDCICLAVMCPADAETIFVKPTPTSKPTATP